MFVPPIGDTISIPSGKIGSLIRICYESEEDGIVSQITTGSLIKVREDIT